MSRIVIVTVPDPSFPYKRGDVIEASAAQQTAIGAGNLRATTYRDQLGEGSAASNTD